MNVEDFKKHAGKWVEVVAQKPIDDDAPLMVGGYWPSLLPGRIRMPCALCGRGVALHGEKDGEVLKAHPKVKVICPDCFLSMDPKDPEEIKPDGDNR